MGYRLALHIFAAIWNFLLVTALWNRRKTPYFRSIALLCGLSSYYSLTWTFGIATESVFWFRVNWFGVTMVSAALLLVAEMDTGTLSRRSLAFSWRLSALIAVLGATPLSVRSIQEISPIVIATYGTGEPLLRAGLGVLICHGLWHSVRALRRLPVGDYRWLNVGGIVIYGVGALGASAIAPLLGVHDLIEFSSWGSVIWTTAAVFGVTVHFHHREKMMAELDRMKTDFIDQVTHDFKSPIYAIQGAVEVMEQEKEAGKARPRYLSLINSNAARLDRFVDDLLTAAAAENGRLTLHRSEFDLTELAMSVVRDLGLAATRKGVDARVLGVPVWINADRAKIERVITNLVSNAITATDEGFVEVRIVREADNVRLSVTDTGCGISPEEQPKIFDRFYRPKNAKSGGMGLGLAVAKAWVEAHGGRIWVGRRRKTATVAFMVPART